MLVPLSWLHEFCDPGLAPEELADVLTLGGLAVEGVHRPTAGTRGVRVLEVAASGPLPGSDKLTLVTATDGQREWEIVCGARNYQVGDRVPAALPGAVLRGSEPGGGMRIERRRMLGHTSNGMLCSPRELGVGDDHSGIWILDGDAPLGAELHEWLDLDDAVLELDVTPDRGYALSVLGVARDVAALTGAPLRLPTAGVSGSDIGADPGVPVVIEDAVACPRFDARWITTLRVGPSPAWVQRRLAVSGMRPRSNLVDATNLAMLETGHPVHAYDRARLRGPRIEVRRARPGERLVTLDDVERKLDPDDLVIADAGGPIGLAGVMGGEHTEVHAGTTDVLLEVAAFDPVAVLRTGRRHGLFTEARTRFEKTVPPGTVPLAATRCASLIAELGGGRVAGGSDAYPAPAARPVIWLRPARARGHLGVDLDTAAQRELLERIACEVGGDGETLAVTPPAYRPDLRVEEDLYEELARLHGYQRIPETLPSTGQAGGRTPADEARRVVRRTLAGAGWTEVLTYPFIAGEDLDALGLAAGDPRCRPIPLVNPLSKEEAVLRTTLLPSLLRAVRTNVNRQNSAVAIFESGRVFLPPSGERPGADGGPSGVVLPAEPTLLGLAACGPFVPGRHDRTARDADLYDLLGAADLVRTVLGRTTFAARPTAEAPFHPGRAARVLVDGVDVGVVGELHPRVAAAFEVPPRTLAGELDLDLLLEGGVTAASPGPPSTLPGIRFDVAVVVDEAVPAAEVEAAVRAGAGGKLSELRLFDVFRGPQLGEGRKSLAYALRLDDPERQLTDTDERAAIEGVAAAVERVGGALRR